MRHVRILAEPFTRKSESHETVLSAPPTAPPVHIELLFSPVVRAQVEDFFEPEQISLQDNGSLKVDADFPEEEWTYSFLLGYGEHVKVLAPACVQAVIHEKVKKILSHYKPDNLLSQP